jgi:hypothetical protein
MLRREEAEKRLEKLRTRDWRKQKVAALGALPEKLRAAGRALLGRDPEGKPFKNWGKERKAFDEAVDLLGKLTARDRQKVFAALFPKLATHLEGAWQLLARLPYEVDFDRKAFRAPDDPAVARQSRAGWLDTLVDELEGYDPDVAWCAAWAPHLGYGGSDSLGVLLAAAIDAGGQEGDEVFATLRASANREHEVGAMGRHVTRALLVASRPDGWEFVEKLLLAAQRQEGLRQVILETVDEAHPGAFRRMLRLILEHNLIRFSSVVRAADVWFGLRWSSLGAGVVKQALGQVLSFLDDPKARTEALAGEKGEALYLALWALGFEDAPAAVGPAAGLLADPDVERRFVAAHFLAQVGLPAARRALAGALDDPDLRVALRALEGLSDAEATELPDLFEPLRRLFERVPARAQDLPALVWPWATTRADRSAVAGALADDLGKRPVTTLLPYLGFLSPYNRVDVAEKLAKGKKQDPAVRDTLFTLAGDRDGWVRERALELLKKCEVTESDARRLEAFLTRTASATRRGVLGLLVKQKVAAALASADRLLASGKAPQRLGGLELLRLLVESKKAVEECRERARRYQAQHPDLTDDERLHVETILDSQRATPTLDDSLGLMDPGRRTPPAEPKARKVALLTPAALGCLASLDELIRRNRQTPVTVRTYEGPQEELLGNVDAWDFPGPRPSLPAGQDAARLPLRALWEDWFANRPKKLRDRDGLELVRASAWLAQEGAWRGKPPGGKWDAYLKLAPGGLSPPRLKHADLVERLVRWLLRLHPPEGAVDFLLDSTETAFALVPEEARRRIVDLGDWQKSQQDWRINSPMNVWPAAVRQVRKLDPSAWADEHAVRFWRLMHWRDRPAPGVARQRPDLDLVLTAFRAGAANEHDVLDQLLGPGLEEFDDLRRLTDPTPAPGRAEQTPAVKALVDRCRERILEIELSRGETPTAASAPAKALQSVYGTDTLLRILRALGGKGFSRNRWGEGRAEALTHLVRVCYPAPGETPEGFAARVKQAGLSEERLLQFGFLAPQWLPFVEHVLGWEGLREGAWWFLAHTPCGHSGLGHVDDDRGDYDEDLDDDFGGWDEDGDAPQKLGPWERLVRERTPLTREERREGAVDVGWFHRAFAPLGPKRWSALAEACRYGCEDMGFKKPRLLSEVLLGRAKKAELVEGIRQRNLKESVRLLGLLPLAEGEKREADLLGRYKVLQEYRRYARGLGPMSREDALRAASIGLENLARTAGYPDPVRLEWAMEARDVADLAAGPVSAGHQGVTVTLTLDKEGRAELTARRGDKALKSVPREVRKHPKVAALIERKNDLKRQAARVRQSLEAAMCRGDDFTGAELRQLFAHPVLAPMLGRLVLLGEGVRGYPTHGGQAVVDHAGKVEPVKPGERLRVAHPHDLLAGGDWDQWQHECFHAERVQPFKQVFRELYVLTAQEKADGAVSRRYAGQQVNPNQAMALLGGRGWATGDGVTRTFHDVGLTASVSFLHHGWTPLEVEGLTLEGVEFTRRGEPRPIPLADVPPRVFSEVMRDLDLVVSVAHVGGVDPEASASTVQMRAALLRETCDLLGIKNYAIRGSHALVEGKLGRYTVHLGSAVVHRQPGGSVCIVPVHAQQRGRLFLPFADDDPRAAEVLSKVILLARDDEIQDPSILEQLR